MQLVAHILKRGVAYLLIAPLLLILTPIVRIGNFLCSAFISLTNQ